MILCDIPFVAEGLHALKLLATEKSIEFFYYDN